MKKIFLDCDGVLTSFMGDIMKHYNIPNNFEFPKGCWDTVPMMTQYLKISGNQFWNLPITFWSEMSKMPEADNLLDFLETLPNEVCLLSSPANAISAHGKILWIQKYLPEYWKRGDFCLNRNKTFLSHSGSILIDDYDKNVDTFNQHGGYGILFPRSWNRRWREAEKPDEAYRTVLEELVKIL